MTTSVTTSGLPEKAAAPAAMRLIAYLALFATPFHCAYAAPIDSGQELRQQHEQYQRRHLPTEIPRIERSEEKAAPRSSDATVVHVTQFTFEDTASLLGKDRLQELVSEYTDRDFAISELNQITSAINQELRSKGYITSRAHLPPQDVTEGNVRIQILEGRLDANNGIALVGDTPRLRSSIAKRIATEAVSAGEVLTQNEVERAVLLLRDLPGISASANLEAGSEPNASRVIIDVEEGPVLQPGFSLANSGSRLTGRTQAAFSLTANNPTGIGDQWRLSFQESIGLGKHRFMSAGTRIPIRYRGLTFHGSIQHLDYESGRELADLDLRGDALQAGIGLDYPLIRSSTSNVSLHSDFELRKLRDEALDTQVNHRRVKELSLSIRASSVDDFFGGGYIQGALQLHQGDLDLKKVEASFLADQSPTGARTDGKYSKLSLSGRRIQRVGDRWNLIADMRGQLASKNLSTSEKLQLGGPSGIRAYPVGEAQGDAGVLTNLEGHYTLRRTTALGDIRLKAFYDWGRIRQFKNPDRLELSTSNSYNLSGYGLGLTAVKQNTFSADFVVARRIGSNPGRNLITGDERDGSHNKTRFWLSVSSQF